MTDAPTRNALYGLCSECEHVWIVAHLPMEMARVGKLMKRAACPKCGCEKVLVPDEADIRRAEAAG